MKIILILMAVICLSGCDFAQSLNAKLNKTAAQPRCGQIIAVTNAVAFTELSTGATNTMLCLFYSDKALPALQAEKNFAQLSQIFSNDFACAKINLSNPNLASLENKFKITAVPTFLILEKSIEKTRIVGVENLDLTVKALKAAKL